MNSYSYYRKHRYCKYTTKKEDEKRVGKKNQESSDMKRDFLNNIAGTCALFEIQFLNIHSSLTVAVIIVVVWLTSEKKNTPKLLQYTSYSFANRNSTIDTVPWSYITALIGNFIPFAMAPPYFGIGITTNLNISWTEKCPKKKTQRKKRTKGQMSIIWLFMVYRNQCRFWIFFPTSVNSIHRFTWTKCCFMLLSILTFTLRFMAKKLWQK